MKPRNLIKTVSFLVVLVFQLQLLKPRDEMMLSKLTMKGPVRFRLIPWQQLKLLRMWSACPNRLEILQLISGRRQ